MQVTVGESHYLQSNVLCKLYKRGSTCDDENIRACLLPERLRQPKTLSGRRILLQYKSFDQASPKLNRSAHSRLGGEHSANRRLRDRQQVMPLFGRLDSRSQPLPASATGYRQMLTSHIKNQLNQLRHLSFHLAAVSTISVGINCPYLLLELFTPKPSLHL